MKIDNIKIISIIMLLFVVIAVGCSRKITEPVSPPINNFVPPTPESVLATVGDRTIVLSWTISDTSRIAHYKIYMSDSLQGTYNLQAEPAVQTYSLSDLQNGTIYFIRVSAVSDSGFEGYRSAPISVTPDVFSILIDNGALYTNRLDLNLALTAPVGTRLMQISNNSEFSGAQWEPFAVTRTWQLLPGDGIKSVYARFRDFNDYSTTNNISDQIELDTKAMVDSVTFEPIQGFFVAGNTVRFRLYSGEPYGSASITVGNNLLNLTLYDDGSMGDSIAGDGIYELNYQIPGFLDFENEMVIGGFTDRAGNTAQQAQAAAFFSVRRHPDAISINSLFPPLQYYDRVEISWGQSQAPDFASYRVYRKATSGVDSSSTLVLLATSAGATTAIDSGLAASTQYYYRVYVVDNTGLWAGSSESHVTTNSDQPPVPVTLMPISTLPDQYQNVTVSWTESGDVDYSNYRLYRWIAGSPRSDSALVTIISDRATTAFEDHPLFGAGQNTITYRYIIHLYDIGGNHAASDSVNATLTDLIPPQVSGNVAPSENSLIITWAPSTIPDFASYRLLRNTTSNPATAITVFVASDSATITYTDANTVTGQTYYYWLDIFDRRDNSSRTLLGSANW